MKMKMCLRSPLLTLAGLGLLFMPILGHATMNPSTLTSVPLSYNGPEQLSMTATVSRWYGGVSHVRRRSPKRNICQYAI